MEHESVSTLVQRALTSYFQTNLECIHSNGNGNCIAICAQKAMSLLMDLSETQRSTVGRDIFAAAIIRGHKKIQLKTMETARVLL